MATGPRYKVAFRRRREGRTDYHQRLKLLVSKQARVVARRSLKHMRLQLVVPKPEGDQTLVHADSTELGSYGYTGPTGNTPSAYLTGLLFGYKAQKAGCENAVLDMGLQVSSKGSRIYAALKGIVDSGLDVPHDPEIFPGEPKIRGEEIKEYTGTDIPAMFDETLAKIKNEFGED
ncbi:MAG: 50S ribosomal protein L18 [Methanosarcinales archaeon]|nr:50S ribosomal protein L18 [Methanosarcinales archaeon]